MRSIAKAIGALLLNNAMVTSGEVVGIIMAMIT
jgi:hypothetical protein